MNWTFLGSNGASCGMLVLWDRRVMEKEEDFIGEFTVTCSFRNVEDSFSWVFAGVYGPNVDSVRSLLQNELPSLQSW